MKTGEKQKTEMQETHLLCIMNATPTRTTAAITSDDFDFGLALEFHLDLRSQASWREMSGPHSPRFWPGCMIVAVAQVPHFPRPERATSECSKVVLSCSSIRSTRQPSPSLYHFLLFYLSFYAHYSNSLRLCNKLF